MADHSTLIDEIVSKAAANLCAEIQPILHARMADLVVIPVADAAKICGICRETFVLNFSEYLTDIGPRSKGVTLHNLEALIQSRTRTRQAPAGLSL